MGVNRVIHTSMDTCIKSGQVFTLVIGRGRRMGDKTSKKVRVICSSTQLNKLHRCVTTATCSNSNVTTRESLVNKDESQYENREEIINTHFVFRYILLKL